VSAGPQEVPAIDYGHHEIEQDRVRLPLA
jgi:hypothetical protein